MLRRMILGAGWIGLFYISRELSGDILNDIALSDGALPFLGQWDVLIEHITITQ